MLPSPSRLSGWKNGCTSRPAGTATGIRGLHPSPSMAPPHKRSLTNGLTSSPRAANRPPDTRRYLGQLLNRNVSPSSETSSAHAAASSAAPLSLSPTSGSNVSVSIEYRISPNPVANPARGESVACTRERHSTAGVVARPAATIKYLDARLSDEAECVLRNEPSVTPYGVRPAYEAVARVARRLQHDHCLS